jgi:hypothetical protein
MKPKTKGGWMLKRKHTVVILAVLLVLALGYIVFDAYSEYKQQQDFSLFQQGAQFGYEQAVTQLFQQALTCQPVPVFIENQTLNLVAVECLQLQENPENQ